MPRAQLLFPGREYNTWIPDVGRNDVADRRGVVGEHYVARHPTIAPLDLSVLGVWKKHLYIYKLCRLKR